MEVSKLPFLTDMQVDCQFSGSPVSSYQYAQNSDPRFVEPRSTFKRSIGTQTEPIKTQVIIIRDPSGAGVIPHPPSILERLPSGMVSYQAFKRT
jgi:hypothetical protein